ncbi:MAG: hypothetical protein ACRYFK_10295 [Janthinobacterium lividum]
MKPFSFRSCLGAAALLSLGLGRKAAAQAPAGWALKATPQHLVLSGYWLEAERARPGHPRQSFTLGPQLYAGPTGRPDAARDSFEPNRDGRVRGAGLQLQHRFYLGPGAASGGVPTGFYLSYAPQLQFFNLRFARLQWHQETGPGNLPYVLYGPVPYHENVLRYGVAGQAGYQWPLGGRALLDVYAGLGLRQSYYWSSFGNSQFRSGPSDYASRGLYVPAGFKLGVLLK